AGRALRVGARGRGDLTTGIFGKLSGPVDFTNVMGAQSLIGDGQVFADGFANISKRLLLRGALGPAARETRHRHAIALLRFVQGNPVFHRHLRVRIICSGKLAASSTWSRAYPPAGKRGLKSISRPP